MLFIMIVCGIFAFAAGFALQILCLAIMERWITRLIPVCAALLNLIIDIISYNAGMAELEMHYDGFLSVMALAYFKMILILCGIAIIGCVTAMIVVGYYHLKNKKIRRSFPAGE